MVAHDFNIPPIPDAPAKSLFKRVEDLLDEINYACYMEVVDADWCYHHDDESSVYWIKDKDIYGSETNGGASRQGDCSFINADTGCGETVTYVFKRGRKMSYGDFLDKYEEYM